MSYEELMELFLRDPNKFVAAVHAGLVEGVALPEAGDPGAAEETGTFQVEYNSTWTADFEYTKVGSIVVLEILGFGDSFNPGFTGLTSSIGSLIPAALRPNSAASSITLPFIIEIDGATQIGVLSIFNSGATAVALGLNGGVWSGTEFGIATQQVTYSVA